MKNLHQNQVQFLAGVLHVASRKGVHLNYYLLSSLEFLGHLPDSYYDYLGSLVNYCEYDVSISTSQLKESCDYVIRVFTDWRDDARITCPGDVKFISRFLCSLKRSRSYLPDNPFWAFSELLVSLYRVEF